jgi:hypothetical protein
VLRLAYIVIFAMLISFLGDLSNLMDIVGLAMLVILCNQQHIAWGSHIISDGWAAYDSIPSDVYTHSVVIHADNFVAPHDACIHTQNIESAWSRMKHKLKCHRGTSQALFDSYIAEHVWRSYRDCDCKFSYLIAEIIRQYPF